MTMLTVGSNTYDIVTLDFETYFDPEYTLKKLSTSEYIRDSRFLIHGVGVIDKWYTKFRPDLIDWTKTALLAHHTAFDGFILQYHFGIVPAFYLDTLSMSRAIHGHHLRHGLHDLALRHGLSGKIRKGALLDTKGKRELTKEESDALGEYCVDDVRNTHDIFWALLDYCPDVELRLIDTTIRMFCEPTMEVDVPRVAAELKRVQENKEDLLNGTAATKTQLASNPQFAMLLKEFGIDPPMKISPRTDKPTYAFAKTDEGFKQLLEHEDERVRNLCAARLAVRSTSNESRAQRLLDAGSVRRSYPVYLHYSGAHTHRWSGGDKQNIQNFTRKGELRKSLLAPVGYHIVTADSSQIEPRTNAWFSEETQLVKAFSTGQDIYSEFASDLFRRPITKADDEERFVGKTCILGLGYTMAALKLQAALASGANGPVIKASIEQCDEWVRQYRAKYRMIRLNWHRMDHIILCMLCGYEGEYGPIQWGKGFIRLPNGMFLQYPNLKGRIEERYDRDVAVDVTYQGRNGRTRLYRGILVENVIQALDRIIIGDQMLLAQDAGYRPIMMSHDEISVLAPSRQADQVLETLIKIMRTRSNWYKDLPLDAEGVHGPCYMK